MRVDVIYQARGGLHEWYGAEVVCVKLFLKYLAHFFPEGTCVTVVSVTKEGKQVKIAYDPLTQRSVAVGESTEIEKGWELPLVAGKELITPPNKPYFGDRELYSIATRKRMEPLMYSFFSESGLKITTKGETEEEARDKALRILHRVEGEEGEELQDTYPSLLLHAVSEVV